MSDPVVRPLQSEDLDLDKGFFTSLRRFALGDMTPELALEIFQEHLEDPKTEVFVVEVGGEVVSTATAFWRRAYIHAGGRVGYLEEVVTRADQEGHGYGVAVVKYALRWLKRVGCYKVILNCEPHNILYYEKMGFVKKDQGMRTDP